jgi:PmbA protein
MSQDHNEDKDYLKLAEDLVARASGGDVEAEAVVTHGQSTMIRVSAGEVREMSRAVSRGLGLRVIKSGRMGYAYTSDFTAPALESTLQAALALADTADHDEHRTLPRYAQAPVSAADLRIYDDGLSGRSVEGKVDLLLEVERVALSYDPRVVATMYCSYHDELSRVYLANSLGFSGSYERTGIVAYLRAVARDESEQASGMGLGWSIFYGDLDPHEIGAEAARRALELLGGTPVRTQQAEVVLDPFAGTELLSFLAEALTGEATQRGRSFLMGKVGEKIAAEGVNLVDEGRLAGGLASAPFDGEGVPSSRTQLVANGRLEALLYDTYTANVEGTTSTGNGQRGSHRTLPRPAPTNLYLEASSTPVAELIGGVEEGLYVTSTMNTGGINPINGDYSVGASGLWVEKGEIVRPVTEVTVAGNMLDMLANVQGTANDLRFIPLAASVGAPTMVIGGMTIAGD